MVEAGAAPSGLAQRLSDMRGQIAAAALDGQSATTERYDALLRQLNVLADSVTAAWREVSAGDIASHHVPVAMDELDAILVHTAEATGLILDECEALEDAFRTSPLRRLVIASTARIYEACSFQDITGQRIAKVLQMLRAIEVKLEEMSGVFGGCPSKTAAPRRTEALLNGPQHSGDAMKQREIDALLASFE